jgi:hypothetical protein
MAIPPLGKLGQPGSLEHVPAVARHPDTLPGKKRGVARHARNTFSGAAPGFQFRACEPGAKYCASAHLRTVSDVPDAMDLRGFR